MSKVQAIALFIVITGALAISGCTSLVNLLPGNHASPTPIPVYNPITPTPVPSPVSSATATVRPVLISSEPSNLVRILLPYEYKAYTWDRNMDGQTENITCIVANDDTKTAEDVAIILSARDNNGVSVFYQEFDIGDLARGERQQVWLNTKSHSDANFITVHMKVTWGEYHESFNPEDYKLYVTAYTLTNN